MPSVDSMVGLITKVDSPYITVHQDRCQLVRNKNADCLRCASVCTSGCIHWDGENLTISPEKCIGCGTCASICPTCCLEAHHPNDAEFLNECHASARQNEGTVVVACGQLLTRADGLYDPDKVVRVECLGRIEESGLTTLVAQGIRDIVLVHGSCETCSRNTGRGMLDQVMATEEQLLDAWNQPMCIRVSDKLPGKVRLREDYDKSRRRLFQETGREAARMGVVVTDYAVRESLGQDQTPKLPERFPKVMDDGTLPHFLPDRREALLNALGTFGEPKDVMIDTRLWGHVIIDTDKCKSCRMCAVFCPTGALQKFGEDDVSPFGVEHYPGDCVKCRCCENICPAGAITISDEVFAVDMLAGMTDAYEMRPRDIKLGDAHTIWHIQQTMMITDQVYER